MYEVKKETYPDPDICVLTVMLLIIMCLPVHNGFYWFTEQSRDKSWNLVIPS